MSTGIYVETRSGAQYHVPADVLECAEDGFVYGYRLNGSKGGPFSRATQNDVRWFYLRNVKVIDNPDTEAP